MKNIIIILLILIMTTIAHAVNYEYHVKTMKMLNVQESRQEKYCNKKSSEGWRLIIVCQDVNGMQTLYFEREVTK